MVADGPFTLILSITSGYMVPCPAFGVGYELIPRQKTSTKFYQWLCVFLRIRHAIQRVIKILFGIYAFHVQAQMLVRISTVSNSFFLKARVNKNAVQVLPMALCSSNAATLLSTPPLRPK